MEGLRESLERFELLLGAVDLRDGPQRAFADNGPADHVWQGKNVLLDPGREAEHAHDLGHPGAGDALLAGDVGLVGGLAGLKEGLPLDGLAEELDQAGLRWAQSLGRCARHNHLMMK